jgi:hypothetical protein
MINNLSSLFSFPFCPSFNCDTVWLLFIKDNNSSRHSFYFFCTSTFIIDLFLFFYNNSFHVCMRVCVFFSFRLYKTKRNITDVTAAMKIFIYVCVCYVLKVRFLFCTIKKKSESINLEENIIEHWFLLVLHWNQG